MKSRLISVFFIITSHLPDLISLYITNILLFIWRKNYTFSKEQKGLYSLRYKDFTVFFPVWQRGQRLYFGGIDRRARSLAESYFIDRVQLSNESVVIECGANNGDLLYYYSNISSVDPINIYAFEPSPREFGSLVKTYRCNLFQKGLGDRIGRYTLYLDEDNADSSFICNGRHVSTSESEVITLLSFFEDRDIKYVDLLKIEAEGFEPEILRAALSEKTRIEYIAVDGGPERGIHNTSTIEEIINFLIAKNYELLHLNLSNSRGRALFKLVK